MKPATPLPWTWMRGAEAGWRLHGGPIDGKREFVLRTVPKIGNQAWSPKPTDAAYIVHACNAYPRLITGLREAMLLLPPDFRHDAAALLKELGE